MAIGRDTGVSVLYSKVTRSCCRHSANNTRSSMVFFKAKPKEATNATKRMMIFMVLFGTNGRVKKTAKLGMLLHQGVTRDGDNYFREKVGVALQLFQLLAVLDLFYIAGSFLACSAQSCCKSEQKD